LKIKKKKEEKNTSLSIFFPRCKKICMLKECPLNNIDICAICTGEKSTEHFPSLLRLKSIKQGRKWTIEKICTLASKRPWHPHPPGMSSDPTF
jgi:hypothetical protein